MATEHQLPLRLIPRKGGQIAVIVFLLIFIGIAGFVIGQFELWRLAQVDHPIGYAVLGFFSIFLLVPLYWIVLAVLKLLPGSPYYYLEIDSAGLMLRAGLRKKRFAWAELSPFAVHLDVRTSRDKDGRTSRTEYYYVIAVHSAAEAVLQRQDERYGKAAFKMLPDEYGAGSGKVDAEAMASWLSDIRAASLSGRPVKTVTVPPEFAETAIRAAAAPALASTGVIERRS